MAAQKLKSAIWKCKAAAWKQKQAAGKKTPAVQKRSLARALGKRPAALFFTLLSLLWIVLARSGVPLPGAQAATLRQQILWEEMDGKTYLVTGRIRSVDIGNGRASFTMGRLRLGGRSCPVRTICYMDQKAAKHWGHLLRIGRSITVEGTVRRFDTARNPGNFDARRYYLTENILGNIRVRSVVKYSRGYSWFGDTLHRFRQRCLGYLRLAMGDENGALARSILLGDLSLLSARQKSGWQKAGFAHVLAVSGLHMSVLGSGLYRLCRRCKAGPAQAAAPSLLLLLVYVFLTGGHVSAWRAFFMFALSCGAKVTGRTYDPVTSMASAACVLIMTRPYSFFGLSFLYSFLSIAAIIFLVPMCGSLPRMLRGMQATVCVTALLCPLTLVTSYEHPLYSYILNWLLLPAFPLFALLGFSGMLLCFIWTWAGRLVLQVAGLFLGICRRMIDLSLRMPQSRQITGNLPYRVAAIYFILLLGAVLWRKRGRRKKAGDEDGCERRRGLVFMCLLILFPSALILYGRVWGSERAAGVLTVTMLDVGQGSCLHIQTPNGKHMLVDGGSGNVNDPARQRIMPYLLYKGVRRLDFVFVTHGDADHMNGIGPLLADQTTGVAIDRLILPPQRLWDEELAELSRTAGRHRVGVHAMGEGDRIQIDGCTIVCLGPGDDIFMPGNAASLVLHISFGNTRFLLTGDVENEGERALLAKSRDLSCDVLQVPHHGSKHVTDRFLQAAGAGVALISVAEKNRYGHPSPETIRRLERQSSRIYMTARTGAVTVRTDGQHIRVNSFLYEWDTIRYNRREHEKKAGEKKGDAKIE